MADTKRPRGWINEWRPQLKTLARLEDVKAVLDQYRADLPLTVRQIFYRLVATERIAKTEKAYKSLAELLVTARRARHIPMSAIRDDGMACSWITPDHQPRNRRYEHS